MNRKQRRKQAKLGSGASGVQPPAFGAADALAMLARRPAPAAPAPSPADDDGAIASAVHAKARVALSSGDVAGAVAAADELADSAWERRRPEVEARKQPGFACAAGCAWCCHQQVPVLAAEAVAIARHVNQHFTAEDRSALTQRLTALDARVRGLGAWARARLKLVCAFLVDGRCSIYAARPLRCRSLFSRDAAHCRYVMENPDEIYGAPADQRRPGPFPLEPVRIVDAAMTGLARALDDRGLSAQPLELTAGLKTALETPDLDRRYAAGEPVFAGAVLPAPDAGVPTSTLAKSGDSA